MNELTADSGRTAVLRGSWRTLPVADRGEGIYLFDVDGRRYLDGSAGSSVVVNIGHGVKPVIDAMYAQMQKVSFAAPHVFANEPLLRTGAGRGRARAGHDEGQLPHLVHLHRHRRRG